MRSSPDLDKSFEVASFSIISPTHPHFQSAHLVKLHSSFAILKFCTSESPVITLEKWGNFDERLLNWAQSEVQSEEWYCQMDPKPRSQIARKRGERRWICFCDMDKLPFYITSTAERSSG
jgi:hypothetical protein